MPLRQIFEAPETYNGAVEGGPGLTVTLYAGVILEHPVAVIVSVTLNVPAPGVFQIIFTEFPVDGPEIVPSVTDHE